MQIHSFQKNIPSDIPFYTKIQLQTAARARVARSLQLFQGQFVVL